MTGCGMRKITAVLLGRLVVLPLVLVVAGCGGGRDDGADAQQHATRGTQLKYYDSEPGVGSYDTRVLVTDDYMRMDDGVEGGDYVLLDRNTQVIYSVTHERRSILEIRARQPDKVPPPDLRLNVRSYSDPAAPRIAGKVPMRYELRVDDFVCRNVVTVPDILPAALRALGEFRRILAGAHMSNLDKTPKEMQDDCFLAYDVFAPERQLQYGFPIQEWDEQGYSRHLLDYQEDTALDEALFSLPEGYERTQIGDAGVETR